MVLLLPVFFCTCPQPGVGRVTVQVNPVPLAIWQGEVYWPPSKVLPLDYYRKSLAGLLRLTVIGRSILSRFYRYAYAGRPRGRNGTIRDKRKNSADRSYVVMCKISLV